MVKYNNDLSSIMVDYRPETAETIMHTGSSVQVNFSPGSTLKGANLGEEYTLAQFHLHWGSAVGHGSEHTVDGIAAEAEIHFVHWNAVKYTTIEVAMEHADGLAVLGAFIYQNDKKSTINQAQQIIKQFRPSGEWNIGEKYPLSG